MTTAVPVDRSRRARVSSLRDDRWPDLFASGFLIATVLVVVITFVPPWRTYFARGYDIVSMLIFPVLPGLRLRGAAGGHGGCAAPATAGGLVAAGHLVAGPARAGSDPRADRRAGHWLARGRDSSWWLGCWSSPSGPEQFAARRVPGNLGRARWPASWSAVRSSWCLGTVLMVRFGTAPDVVAAGVHVLDGMLGRGRAASDWPTR